MNLEWTPVPAEEVKTLKFATRSGSRDSSYGALLAAVEHGPIRVPVPKDTKLQNLKWALSRAIKKAGLSIEIATLEDKSGVVLTKAKQAPTPAALPKPTAESPKK